MIAINYYYHCQCVGSYCLFVSMSSLAAMIHTNKIHRGGANSTMLISKKHSSFLKRKVCWQHSKSLLGLNEHSGLNWHPGCKKGEITPHYLLEESSDPHPVAAPPACSHALLA